MALFHQIRRAAEPEQQSTLQTYNQPASGALPAEHFNQATTSKQRGRKPDPNAKKLLTLRLDPDVIEHFKATGEGWQTRMNEALRKAAGI